MTMANQDNFNLLSFNVRGINNKKKRLSVFRWLNKKQADIIYLQKTYKQKKHKMSDKLGQESDSSVYVTYRE